MHEFLLLFLEICSSSLMKTLAPASDICFCEYISCYFYCSTSFIELPGSPTLSGVFATSFTVISELGQQVN